MFQRKTTGSVVCPACGSLVGVRDDKCYMCGRVNPGLWGFAPALRQLGADFGFVPLVIGASSVLYVPDAARCRAASCGSWAAACPFSSPSVQALLLFGPAAPFRCSGLGSWWTVLSASWLHGKLLHILFNMMWVRDLGPATADIDRAGADRHRLCRRRRVRVFS